MADIKKDQDLREYIDRSNIDCKNQNQDKHPISGILAPDGRRNGVYLESNDGTDCQLIIDVSFNQRVNLRKIRFFTDPEFKDHAPKDIHILVNSPGRVFADMDDLISSGNTFAHTLTEDEINGEVFLDLGRISVRLIKPVDSIQIFVQTNQMDDEFSTTRIDGLEFWGITNDAATTTDLSALGKRDDDD